MSDEPDEQTPYADRLCACDHFGDVHSLEYPGKCLLRDCDCERFREVPCKPTMAEIAMGRGR